MFWARKNRFDDNRFTLIQGAGVAAIVVLFAVMINTVLNNPAPNVGKSVARLGPLPTNTAVQPVNVTAGPSLYGDNAIASTRSELASSSPVPTASAPGSAQSTPTVAPRSAGDVLMSSSVTTSSSQTVRTTTSASNSPQASPVRSVSAAAASPAAPTVTGSLPVAAADKSVLRAAVTAQATASGTDTSQQIMTGISSGDSTALKAAGFTVDPDTGYWVAPGFSSYADMMQAYQLGYFTSAGVDPNEYFAFAAGTAPPAAKLNPFLGGTPAPGWSGFVPGSSGFVPPISGRPGFPNLLVPGGSGTP